MGTVHSALQRSSALQINSNTIRFMPTPFVYYLFSECISPCLQMWEEEGYNYHFKIFKSPLGEKSYSKQLFNSVYIK